MLERKELDGAGNKFTFIEPNLEHDFYDMVLQPDLTMQDVAEILNAFKFAISKDIFDKLSETTKRHFVNKNC